MCNLFHMTNLMSLFVQYRFYGEQVVRACVENSCHHVDISGEPQVTMEITALKV